METYDNRPIGVFDSGLGGLTVVNYLTDMLPNETFVYFGDTARTPYGSKSIETIKTFAEEIDDFLITHNVKMIVIACNTVSAVCLNLLRERHGHIPVIGMIASTAKKISKEFGAESSVGIIGTKVTVDSKQYETIIKRFRGSCRLASKACPLFVPTIEEGIKETSILEPIIKFYLDDFIKEHQLDALVLGCTHYPLLEKEIGRIYPDLQIINPSYIVASEVLQYLYDNNMCSLVTKGKSFFYASDLSDSFVEMSKSILDGREVIIAYKNFEER